MVENVFFFFIIDWSKKRERKTKGLNQSSTVIKSRRYLKGSFGFSKLWRWRKPKFV